VDRGRWVIIFAMIECLSLSSSVPSDGFKSEQLQSGNVSPSIPIELVEDWSGDIEDIFWPSGAARRAFYDQFPALRVHFTTPDSYDRAVAESVAGDIPLLAIAVVVICAFTTVAMSVRDTVYTRTSLSFLGIANIILSITSGFGLSLLLTIPFTSLHQVLPFILLGIGVDDLFVLMRALEEVDEQQPGLSTENRFHGALKLGGMSITATSLTNCSAFLFGSLTSIPAVQWCVPSSQQQFTRVQNTLNLDACEPPRI
jgi:hypothetical protein